MSGVLNIMAIQRAVKNKLESDTETKELVEEVLIEPNDMEKENDSIFIFRQSVSFEPVSMNKNFRAAVFLELWCNTVSFDRNVELTYEKNDILVEKTARVVQSNTNFGTAHVITSKLNNLDWHLQGEDLEDFIAVARLSFELSIAYK